MSNLFKVCLIICAGIILNNNSFSQSTPTTSYGHDPKLAEYVNTITTAVPFLMIAPDSRSGAMGDAGVAISPDANSMHWNPAKFAFIEKDMGLSISYTPWLRALIDDINLGYIGFYKRIDNTQVLSASLLYFSLGDITFTNDVGNYMGQFSPNEFAIDMAYSRLFSNRIAGGLAFRYIHSNLTGGIYVGGVQSHPGNAVSSDISVFYQNDDIEIDKKDAILAFGLNLSNIGTKISYTENQDRDFIPMNMKLGGALTIDFDEYNSLCFTSDINKLLTPTPPEYLKDSLGGLVYDGSGNPVIQYGKDPDVAVPVGMFQSFYDAPGGFREEINEFSYSVGIEYWYAKQFALRAGYFGENQFKGNRKFFTVGFGIKLNVFGLDFAYLIPRHQKNPLENTLRFTLLFDFEGLKSQDEGKDPRKPSIDSK